MRTLIKNILAATEPRESVTLAGWVRTRRDSKGFSFLELNDGSCFASIQCVVDAGTPGFEDAHPFLTGASVEVQGALVASPAAGQKGGRGGPPPGGHGRNPTPPGRPWPPSGERSLWFGHAAGLGASS